MEKTREVDLTSMVGSDVPSIDNFSTYSHSTERKNEGNIPDDNSDKLSLIIEALNEAIAEQNARSREISEVLNSLDIEPKDMSKLVQDTWSKVSVILRAEGIAEVDETLLKLRMEEKRRESMRKAREERKLKGRYDELCENHSYVLKRQTKARESTESLQKFVETEWANNEEEYANRIFLATKLNDYRQTAVQLEEKLKRLVTTDHLPDKILEKHETYLKLVEESNLLDEALSKYGDLPPNLSEARIMVEEKQKYLKDLEHALFEKMKS